MSQAKNLLIVRELVEGFQCVLGDVQLVCSQVDHVIIGARTESGWGPPGGANRTRLGSKVTLTVRGILIHSLKVRSHNRLPETYDVLTVYFLTGNIRTTLELEPAMGMTVIQAQCGGGL